MTGTDAQLLERSGVMADLPGLERARRLLSEEARSFPGPEGSAAFAAAIRALEREIRRLDGSTGVRT